MFFNLFKKEEKKTDNLNAVYAKIKAYYGFNTISEERKLYLDEQLEKYGYLPYPHIKVLEELSEAETLYALEKKWEKEGVLKNGIFEFDNNQISPLCRRGIDNPDWIKKEQHNIKLVNLAGLGNGNKTQEPGKFIDWLRQLLILPSGMPEKGVLACTIYLIPFHPREFGCAYLPSGYGVSPNLEDKQLKEACGLDVEEQVKLFIELSQLAGHPVIYDVLPQSGRYSKLVLSNPQIARWFDIPKLIALIEDDAQKIAIELKKEYEADDVEIVKNLVINILNSGAGDISENYLKLYNEFLDKLLENKKSFSEEMMKKNNQIELVKRVKKIVAKVNGNSEKAVLCEDDIKKQGEIIQELIKEGLWTAPGGAWCSSGVPVFDKMSECATYPMFRHFDYKDNDVTEFANLDCQTPFYFVFLENGQYNNSVIDFYVDFLKKMQSKYNFDGYRVDHIDHVADSISEADGVPISYRAPQKVLAKVNSALKAKNPYFATLAEYMLWDRLYAQYHYNMKFDILWGNDIIMQSKKTPQLIVEDNQELAQFNTNDISKSMLSILKTYNNQDGEFREINQYPGQLGENGALFKWLKLKFLPGGKNANRPVMFIDGDESFTKTGIEGVIGAEVSMPREKNYNFFEKFDAINRFALQCELTREGEAEIILQEDDGFCAWLISKEMVKESLLVIANWLPNEQEVQEVNDDGIKISVVKKSLPVENKLIELPCDYTVVAEVKLPEYGIEMWEQQLENQTNIVKVERLEPSEFRIFKLVK